MGRGVRMYDPPKSKAYKEVVADLSRSHMKTNGIDVLTEPLIIELDFYFKPPKSYSKKKLRAIDAGEMLYTKKPDLDNLAKSVLDGMNGIVFKDDSQITTLIIRKKYGDKEYTNVTIK